MTQGSMPAATEVYYKLRSQRMQAVRLGATLSTPGIDSDSVLADIQNEADLSVDFDPTDEKYDFFYRAVNENQVGKVLGINRTVIRTTLSGAIPATGNALTLVAPTNTNTFKVGDVIEIEDELLVLLTWDTGSGAATVEERGAHGTVAVAHSDAVDVALMQYTVPHNSLVLSGGLDNLLPLAPTSFVLTDVVGAIGNGISMLITLPTTQLKSLFRVHIQTSTVLWPEDFENLTGTTGTQASGSDGAITQGGSTLTTSTVLNTGWAGKLIHTNESIDLSTGEASAPDILRILSVVDNGDGTWTVTKSGENTFNLRRGVLGTPGVVNWVIVDDFRSPGDPSTWVEQVKPFFNQGAAGGDPDVLDVQHILWTAETVFARCRLRNFEGYGPWMYHDGSIGTTTRASATTFNPLGIGAAALQLGIIGETQLADNAVTAAKLTENSMNYNSDLVFSATDRDTVAWTTGTVTFADGSTFSMDAGNTGNMTALTYVYLDPDVSITVLQTTTVFGTAVGDRKQIIAWAQDTALSGEKAFFNHLFGNAILNSDFIGTDAITVTQIADNSISTPKLQANSVDTAQLNAGAVTTAKIDAGAVTANEIQANTITGNEISGTTLSAIFADIGTITAGVSITGVLIRTASSGERIELTSADSLDFYNSGGTQIGSMDITAGGDMRIETTLSGSNLVLNPEDDLVLEANNVVYMTCDRGTVSVIFTQDINMSGLPIASVGDIELDSLTKDGAGAIAVNDDFDMNSNDILECVNITPTTNNTGSVGSAALTYGNGWILNLTVGALIADNGTNIDVADDLNPNADNSFTLGHNGGDAARWSNISAVLTDFGDVGFHNKWKMREWPCTVEDVQKQSPSWMRANANLGIQFLDDDEKLIAVLHKDGYLYCKGIRPLEELPV